LGHALTVSRKIDEIASSTGDMISQQVSWTKSDVAKLLSGASFILQPYETTGLTITVAVDDIAKSGSATVNWSAPPARHHPGSPKGPRLRSPRR
ncbi:hypothetical protein ACC710_36770, partial [Rhizobium ruizarguesonis]